MIIDFYYSSEDFASIIEHLDEELEQYYSTEGSIDTDMYVWISNILYVMEVFLKPLRIDFEEYDLFEKFHTVESNAWATAVSADEEDEMNSEADLYTGDYKAIGWMAVRGRVVRRLPHSKTISRS